MTENVVLIIIISSSSSSRNSMTSTTEYVTIQQQCSINNSTYLTKLNIIWYTEYVNNSVHEQHVTENFGTLRKEYYILNVNQIYNKYSNNNFSMPTNKQ